MALLSWLTGSTSRSQTGARESAAGASIETGGHSPRYCCALAENNADLGEDFGIASAWTALEQDMALVPAGKTTLCEMFPVAKPTGFEFVERPVSAQYVDAVYIDRHAVSNADFLRFIDDGSYKEVDFWPEEILPYVLQFVDSTGRCGPRYWANGRPPAKKLDHPVVGICWFEACAYAAWTGKCLPTPEKWQRAGTWSGSSLARGPEQRYPWGNAFESDRANTWSARHNDTVSVQKYAEGCTPNGVHQLIGNVWEWTAASFECPGDGEDLRVVFDQPLAEIRGGAFDTYFDLQATCQFSSGKPFLFRGNNVGFRCCIDADSLRPQPDPLDLTRGLATF